MTIFQTLSIVAIGMILAGVIAPALIKWIIKKQKDWRFKFIKDNGRFDLIDEFNYWYKRLASERESLELAANDTSAKAVGDDVVAVLSDRLNLLNKFFASRITGDNTLDAEAASHLTELIDNRQQFMDSTRLAFMASKPALMHYLESRGLTQRELNYCCLYMIGLRAKEIGNYLGLRSHYNVSSSIRTKLGLDPNSTNLGIYLRKLLADDAIIENGEGAAVSEYTPRQVRGALLSELFFDYLGWIIVACVFLHENFALEIMVIASALLFVALAIYVLIAHRSDIMPVVKLVSSMNQFGLLSLLGTLAIILLFAEELIPLVAYPYIGYPAFAISQFTLLYGLYRYTK